MYILITIALSSGSGATSQMATQFNTQKACQEAFDHLVKVQSKIVPIGCYPKG